MKLSAVYKSPKRIDTYLYIEKRDDFSKVPKVLMSKFGKPQYVMLVALDKHRKIANIEKNSFIEKMQKDGFYLQMPPHQDNLLDTHLKNTKPQQTPSAE